MKRICSAVTLAAVIALTCTGCSSSEEGSNAPVVINEDAGTGEQVDAEAEDQQSEGEAAASEDDMYTFVYDGTTIAMNADSAPVIEALGDNYNYTSTPSCAYQGMDYVYTYDHLIIRAYTETMEDEEAKISGVEFRDDTVFTPERISIGSTRSDVIDTYGRADSDEAGGLIYDNGTTSVTFFLEGESVVGISYALDLE